MKTWALTQLISALTPVIIPIVLLGAKKAIAALPPWTLPILAPILGALLDVANGYLTGTSLGGVWGAVLGGAAVGLREIIDQLRKLLAGR